MLFTMAIAIFSLIGGTVGDIDNYIGCNSEFKGVVKYWKSLDELFILIDKTLCSDECKCKLTVYAEKLYHNEIMLKDNFMNYFKHDIVNSDNIDKDKDVINIQNCPSNVKDNITNAFNIINKEKYNSDIKKFNLDKFAKYWSYVEKKFQCSGFCSTAYQDKTQRTILKYLFTDVNKTIPLHKGCFHLLLKWLKNMLLAYGSLSLISSCISIATFVSGIYLLVIDPSAGIRGQQYEETHESNVMSNNPMKKGDNI